jgi:hypothetical protein
VKEIFTLNEKGGGNQGIICAFRLQEQAWTLDNETSNTAPTTGIKKNKTNPVTGRGSLYDCDMLWIPHCLDN